MNIEAMLKEGIRAYKAKKNDEARTLFEKVTELDPNNEQGWLWRSAVVDSEEDQRVCLENVLFLNPNNANAIKGLEVLDKKAGERSGSTPVSKPPTATSSASAVYQADDVPEEVYDDWIDNMNLGGASGAASANPFEATSFDDDSIFDADPFNDPPPTTNPYAATYDEDEYEEEYEDYGDDDVFDDPFNTGDDLSDLRGGSGGPFEVEDMLDDELFPATPPTARTSPKSPVSPTGGGGKGSRRGGADAFVDEGDYTSTQSYDDDPGVYYRVIPKEIRATRLPGTDESMPIGLVLMAVVLVAANIGAIGFLISRLAG